MSLSRARLSRLRALRTAKGRQEQSAFLIDGEKLVRDAVAAGAAIEEVLATVAHALETPSGVAATEISQADAERLSETRTPQGVFALLRDTVPSAESAIDALAPGPQLVVVLDGVQDPGNVGALIRSAAAFGASLVIAGPETADPTHPRVLRAATGAWWSTSVARAASTAEALDALRSSGCTIAGAGTEGQSIFEFKAPERLALVFGSEGGGLSETARTRVESTVRVPMRGGVESLNVAVAGGIMLAELERRRS